MLKQFVKDYFNFTRKERLGIIFLLSLIIFFLFLPFFFQNFISAPKYDHSQFEKEITALNKKQPDSNNKSFVRDFDENNYQNYYQPSEKNYFTKQPKVELFYFDPNTLSEEGWIKLGIREKTAKTIQNYLSKGGKFYKAEDIGKIWGLREDEIKRLIPFVRIAQNQKTNYTADINAKPYKNYEKPKNTITYVDINTADTSAFIALPGIGGKLANRIIAFRDKLGGFYKIDQVAETFALPDSTFRKIKDRLIIGNTTVKKLNINNAGIDELKAHPYIRYNIANAIIQYRTQHGQFSALSDLKKIMLITEEIYNKSAPYLTIQ